jgi:hypothetical protein
MKKNWFAQGIQEVSARLSAQKKGNENTFMLYIRGTCALIGTEVKKASIKPEKIKYVMFLLRQH